MTGISRRTILRGSAAVSGAFALPQVALSKSSTQPDIFIYDGRLAASRFAAAQGKAASCIDVASCDDERWVSLRSLKRGQKRVEGLTRWSDWVIVRGYLEEAGLRAQREDMLSEGRLISWEMA